MEGKKRVGIVVGGMDKNLLDEIMIYTVTDESKLKEDSIRAIAGICKNAVFISLTTELFYIYRNGSFKLICPKHIKT